ncbi:MAG: hypothetical protein AAB657_00045 [Patescibacteria group bacterium]
MIKLPLWRKELWSSFWRHPLLVMPVAIILVVVFANWLVVLTFWSGLTEIITLRYSIYFGGSWLDKKEYLLLLPSTSLIFNLFNFWLAYKVSRGSLILKTVTLWGGVVVSSAILWLSLLLIWYNV